MAFIDYGAIVFRNGVCITGKDDFFSTPESVGVKSFIANDYSGWHSTDGSKQMDVHCRDYAYAGDENLLLGFYKTQIFIFTERTKCIKYFQKYYHYEKQFKPEIIEIPEYNVRIKIRTYTGIFSRMFIEFTHNGVRWNIVSGYGIDCDYTVFNKVWKQYRVTKKEKRLIDELYQKSDEITNRMRKSIIESMQQDDSDFTKQYNHLFYGKVQDLNSVPCMNKTDDKKNLIIDLEST